MGMMGKSKAMPNNLDEYTGWSGEETDLMCAEAFPQPENQCVELTSLGKYDFVRLGAVHIPQYTYTANGRWRQSCSEK